MPAKAGETVMLMAMQTGTSSLKDNFIISSKLKMTMLFYLEIPHVGIYPLGR